MSRAVSFNRREYEQAFVTRPTKENVGEGTFFVLVMLNLLSKIVTVNL